MSYGHYSELYYANGATRDNKILVKIGESSNSRRRNLQIEPSVAIYSSLQTTACGYDHSARLFVESYIRTKVQRIQGVERYKDTLDYFLLPHKQIDDFILQNFTAWVQEAVTVWEHI